ncbi:hypothetical protein [Paenibacillus lautus]|uniref:hypothetical protein n=1 Tax=Paenibacillus lautus TaxID=1401 RepID=UPI001BD1AEB5|nr:hypothetical protein [Paenibacillus lautus]
MSSFDTTYGWCGYADDHTDKRDLLLKRYVTEVGIFNFIWGALEAIIDIIEPPAVPHVRGKINKTCNFINLHFHNKLPYYLDLLHLLHECFSQTFSNLKQVFSLKPYINISGVALFAIYKVRNRLAHGVLQIPDLIDIDGIIEENKQIKLIQLCSRLILLTIQMLIISFYKYNNLTFKFDPSSEELEYGEPNATDNIITLDFYLRIIHLGQEDADENQLVLSI